MSAVQKILSQQLVIVNIPTCQQINLFELQTEGLKIWDVYKETFIIMIEIYEMN